MCTVSMVGDFYGDKFKQEPYQQFFINPQAITRKEFDDLKKEVKDMKELLKRAKIYDENNNEPNCEIDEKMDKLRKMAQLVGIDLDDVIKEKGKDKG